MKRKLVTVLIGPALLALGAVSSPTPGLAQGAPPSADIKIQSPTSNQTVGTVFNIAFTVSQACLASGTPEFIIAEAGNDTQPYGVLDASLVNNDGATYTFRVDASRQLRYQQSNFNPPRYLKRGRTTITVSADRCANEQNQEVVINYQPSPATQPPVASATPSPSPTPTVTPRPAKDETETGWLDNLDPVFVLLIGAVAGGGATGLAEYSWIRHRRKHKGSGSGLVK